MPTCFPKSLGKNKGLFLLNLSVSNSHEFHVLNVTLCYKRPTKKNKKLVGNPRSLPVVLFQRQKEIREYTKDRLYSCKHIRKVVYFELNSA